MNRVKHHTIDIRPEKELLIILIVSNKACQELLQKINLNVLQVDYVKKIIEWIKSYFEKYNKSPGIHIKDIYKAEKENLDKNISNLIEIFLLELSKEYEEWETFNEDYFIDKAIEYIDERNLIYLFEKGKALVETDQRDKAKQLITNFTKIAKQTSKWVNPFDEHEINNAMDYENEILFKFPGALGDLMGPLLRGYFIAFLAPIKRGKTWMLLELAILGLLNRCKVIFISLEMSKERMERRFYKRLASVMNKKGLVRYPAFDCLNNQDDSCDMKERTNKIRLLNKDDELPEYSDELEYRPCSYCRKRYPKKYIQRFWYVSEERDPFDLTHIRKTIKSFKTTFKSSNLRLICYRKFTANLSQISQDINMLEYTENFIPDVIIIDYADILAPEYKYDDTRRIIDETWMTLGGMAEDKKCLLATVSQTGKQSWEAKNVKAKDVSEDYRKLAHVDIGLTLSQKPSEKRQGIMRIGICAHRDEDFNEYNQVVVLQQLNAGQPLIDSEHYIEEEQ